VEVLTLSEEGRLLIGGFTLVVRGPDGACRTLPRQRHARVTAACWCGGRLAVGDLTGVVEVWRDGQPERDLEGHTGAVLALGWDAEGAQLCSVATDGTLRTWETSPEDPLVTRIRSAFEGLLATPVTDRVIARYVADECWSRWTDPLFLPEEP